MSHPDRLPDLFVDRSLGRIEVPRLLRDHGLRLTTLAERYGIPADERVSDVRWLKDSGERGEAVLMKDARIRYNEAEKIAVMRFGVQCFCLSRQDLPAADMANRFIRNIDRIADACFRSTGGFILVVDEARLRRVL